MLAGIAVNAGEILVRALAGNVPAEWFYGRRFQGAIGYHSAQANLCAIGLALAVASLSSRSVLGRVARCRCCRADGSILLLTQSRAGIGVAVLVVRGHGRVAARRRARSCGRCRPRGRRGCSIGPLKSVDRALVDQPGIEHALRVYAGWSLLVIVALSRRAPAPALRAGRATACAPRDGRGRRADRR